MTLTFLGASHGIPEPHRRCSCTMVTIGERIYFVDMGVMAICDLTDRGLPVEAVKGIFITHMHGDHTNGLIHFADLISWYYTASDPEIFLPLLEGKEIIDSWIALSCHATRDLRYKQVAEGSVFDDGFLKVTAVRTQHTKSSFSYRLEAEGKAVLFTGDLRRPDADFPKELAKDADLIICEGAHFPATEYKPFLEEASTGRVIVNHYAPWNIPHIMELSKALPDLHITMATDGMEVNL